MIYLNNLFVNVRKIILFAGMYYEEKQTRYSLFFLFISTKMLSRALNYEENKSRNIITLTALSIIRFTWI